MKRKLEKLSQSILELECAGVNWSVYLERVKGSLKIF